MPKVFKLVITGGPCGGMSTGIKEIEKHYTALGYKVILINQTSDELIKGGVTPWEGESIDFHYTLLSIQLYKERMYSDWSGHLNSDKVLIVCERGALDYKVHLTQTDFDILMEKLNTNEVDLRESYDAVFHLISVVNISEEAYYKHKKNDKGKIESPEQIRAFNEKFLTAWTGHPNLYILESTTDFESKIANLISEIAEFLGVPKQPYHPTASS